MFIREAYPYLIFKESRTDPVQAKRTREPTVPLKTKDPGVSEEMPRLTQARA